MPGYIFEGPDRSGKTTIACEIALRSNLQYFKNKAETQLFKKGGDTFKTQLEFCGPYLITLLEQLDFRGNGIVFDRLMPSEFAYSFAFDRETNEDVIWWMDQKMADMGYKLVVCYKSFYNMWDDDVVKRQKVPLIIEGYRRYTKLTKMPHITIDTMDEDLDAQIATILEEFKS